MCAEVEWRKMNKLTSDFAQVDITLLTTLAIAARQVGAQFGVELTHLRLNPFGRYREHNF